MDKRKRIFLKKQRFHMILHLLAVLAILAVGCLRIENKSGFYEERGRREERKAPADTFQSNAMPLQFSQNNAMPPPGDMNNPQGGMPNGMPMPPPGNGNDPQGGMPGVPMPPPGNPSGSSVSFGPSPVGVEEWAALGTYSAVLLLGMAFAVLYRRESPVKRRFSSSAAAGVRRSRKKKKVIVTSDLDTSDWQEESL